MEHLSFALSHSLYFVESPLNVGTCSEIPRLLMRSDRTLKTCANSASDFSVQNRHKVRRKNVTNLSGDLLVKMAPILPCGGIHKRKSVFSIIVYLCVFPTDWQRRAKLSQVFLSALSYQVCPLSPLTMLLYYFVANNSIPNIEGCNNLNSIIQNNYVTSDRHRLAFVDC